MYFDVQNVERTKKQGGMKKMTKNLGVAITDDADEKLDHIMELKKFKNRADAIEWLIQDIFRQLFKGVTN